MINEQRRDELKKLREELKDFPIIPEKTQELIEKLVDAKKPKMVLELGSGKGFSGSVILSTTEDSCLVTIEFSSSVFLKLSSCDLQIPKRSFTTSRSPVCSK